MITRSEAREADARRKLARADAVQISTTCKTCTNKVSQPWFTQCDDCIEQRITIEEYEVAEAIVNRVLAGCCQNCGKKETCTCKFIG